MHKPTTFALLSLLLLPGAQAQVVDIGGCRAVQDPEDRFRCYEALGAPAESAAPATLPAPASAPAQPAQAAEPAASITVDSFGDPAVRARVERDESGKVELHDTVAGLKRLRQNVWEVTLASGQVWRQSESKPYNLKEGDSVRVSPTRWGDDYRLSAEHLSGFIQVRRLH